MTKDNGGPFDTEAIEAAAEDIWQAESIRAAGGPRRTTWQQIGNTSQEPYRGMARAALDSAWASLVDRKIAEQPFTAPHSRAYALVRLPTGAKP